MERIHCLRALFLLLIVSVTSLKAQFPNPVSFNTAVNAGLNGTIPIGTNDLSWTTSSVSMNGPWIPAVRGSNLQAWLVSPYPTADWITLVHCSATSTLNLTQHSCKGNVDDYFRLMFSLPVDTCNDTLNFAGGYCLNMNFYADNQVHEIFVNGVSAYLNTSAASGYTAIGFSATGGASVSLCDYWHPGTNTLIAHVMSGPPTIGFLAFVTDTATPPVSFSVAASHNNVSCFGLNNGMANVSLPGYQGTPTYTWLPTGGNAPTAMGLSPGIYSVTVQLPLCNFTKTLSISEPGPFTVNVSTAQAICMGGKATYTASGGNTYQWLPTSLNTSVVTLSPSGTAVYTLSSTNTSGCNARSVFTLQVLKCTDIVEHGLDNLTVLYHSGTLFIESDGTGILEILDLNGKQVYKDEMYQKTEVDVGNLPAGFYLMRVSNENSSHYRKIVIDR
jgi:hypothetical protein